MERKLNEYHGIEIWTGGKYGTSYMLRNKHGVNFQLVDSEDAEKVKQLIAFLQE